MKKLICLMSLAVFVFVSSGCVSTSSSSNKKVDPYKASEANVKLGMAYLDNGNREGAIRSFVKALDINKKSAGGHHGMGLIYQLNGELEAAERSFKQAIRSPSKASKSPIYFSYARFLFEQKQYTESIKMFEVASSDVAFTGRAYATHYLGLVALKLNNKARAKGAFEQAINLNPKIAEPALELAIMAFDVQNYAESKRYLDHFVKSTRHTPKSLWLGIRIERIFGNTDKEASYAIALKNLHPYSKEYLDYKSNLKQQK